MNESKERPPGTSAEGSRKRLSPAEFERLVRKAHRQGQPIDRLVKRYALEVIDDVFHGLEPDAESAR